MEKRTMVIISSLAVILLLALAGAYWYHAARFNANVAINDTKVGGMTADQALKKLKSSVSKNEVYVGNKQIYNGKDTKSGFTEQDLNQVKNLLKKQRTFFPSSKEIRFTLRPSNVDEKQNQTMKKQFEDKLLTMNKRLKAPKDAAISLKGGKIAVSKSEAGNQYDAAGLAKELQKHAYSSEIHLKPKYLQPLTADSPKIQKEKKMLQELLQRTVGYKLQDKVYPFKGNELSASVKNGKYVIDMTSITSKLNELNQSKATLNKPYTFKTHSNSVISVKGQSYGWAIKVDAEAKRILNALEQGKKTVSAYNIYGVGWNINGVGYHNPANHGIGSSYVEVSIKDQRMWVYKDGKLKVTTHVVTGTHAYNEDTPKGVWYIEYKQSPSILQGSEVGNSNYSIKVSYWAPFTMSGCGLHDASWRTNWASNAYLNHGSGGCVNTPPSVMESVYNNVSQYEPVVVY